MKRLLFPALAGLVVALAAALPALAQSASSQPFLAQLAPSNGEPRLALVFGNSKYAQSPLKNAANDARAVSRSLRGLGFEVIEQRKYRLRSGREMVSVWMRKDTA